MNIKKIINDGNPLEKKREYKGSNIYFKFRKIVLELLNNEGECVICGTRKDLRVHHTIPCEKEDKLYTDKKNLVVICKKCHHEYHKKYNKVNPTTLLKFKEDKIKE